MRHVLSAFFAALFLLFNSPNAGHVDSVTLNKTDLTLSPGQSETLVATLKPDGVRALVTWASSDESVVTVDSKGTVTAVAPGTATINVKARTQKAKCDVTVRIPMEPVDLGIRIAGEENTIYNLIWGDRNLGAESPYQQGDYHACGDGLVDAAVASLEGGWRTPSALDLKVLCESCIWTWEERSEGLSGYNVTSTENGQSIFLPAGGSFWDVEDNKGVIGCYASSDPGADENYADIQILSFDSHNRAMSYGSRFRGYSIRPVIAIGLDPAEETVIMENSVKVALAGTYSLSAEMSPYVHGAKFTWVSDDESIASVDNGVITGRTAGKTTVSAWFGETLHAECEVEVIAPEAVDLGMLCLSENGRIYELFWADRNLGALSPEDHGNYYAWGEVDSKSSYDSYTYCGPGMDVTSLNADQDVAHVFMGGKWRMPTRTEFEQLAAFTGQSNPDGKAGFRMDGEDGKGSIFFPAAGYIDGSLLTARGTGFAYWSSSRVNEAPAMAWSFRGPGHYSLESSRYNGYTVRPVIEGKTGTQLTPEKLSLDITEAKLQTGLFCEVSVSSVPWQFAKSSSITWRSSNNYTVAITKEDGNKVTIMAVAPGKATLSASFGTVKATCEIEVTPYIVPEGAVDIGHVVIKRDGTRYDAHRLFWAACNLGASRPEEYGDYYAWGETRPKSVYDWSNYKWCNDGSWEKITKYFNNYDKLQPEDDAAHVKLGGKWRMPTSAEFRYFQENLDISWGTKNGVNGVYVKDKDSGNSIFLPAAGFRDNSAPKEGPFEIIYYWTCELSSASTDGKCLFMKKQGNYTGYSGYSYPRNLGLPIRAVTE